MGYQKGKLSVKRIECLPFDKIRYTNIGIYFKHKKKKKIIENINKGYSLFNLCCTKHDLVCETVFICFFQ